MSAIAPSDASVAAESLASSSAVMEVPEPEASAPPQRRVHARRISYFMLFRLAIVAGFTVLAGTVAYTSEDGFSTAYSWFVWGTLVVAYALTIVFARLLRSASNLTTFAWVQTTVDIALTAVVVQMSGGVDSGFVSLYLISILGAATMGTRRQIWVAASLCVGIYVLMSVLQFAEVVIPQTVAGPAESLSPRLLWSTAGRTVAGMVGVTVLSAYLNTQLASSVFQVGSLRALNENIVRSLTSGLVTVDADGAVLYFNPTAAQLLALDETALGSPVEEILPGITAHIEHPQRPAERRELEFESERGVRVHLGLSTAPLLDADGTPHGHIINFQDVTRLHQLQRQVRRNERLAAIGGLGASVAHEIRNPLAAISGSAELLAGAQLGDEDQRLLAIIHRESTRLSDLVTDLLSFTRPRPAQMVVLDLVGAVGEAAEAFNTDPGNADIDVHFTAESGVMARADPAQLSQVLWNLMRNAADAMGGKGTVRVRVTRDADRASIAVVDSGEGIEGEALDKIFDPFFTTKESGTGFGLAIVHRIVQDHGGTIRAESKLGEGATFTLTLPLVSGG